MRTIDIHAHISPQGFIDAMNAVRMARNPRPKAVGATATTRGRRGRQERLADMDSLGVDVQ